MSDSLLQAKNENRELQRKLDEERREKGLQSHRNELEKNRLASDLKSALEQKAAVERELNAVRSSTLPSNSPDSYERKIRAL